MATVRDLASGREVTLPGLVALPASVPAAVDAPLATMERERRRETIRRTLAHHAGKNLDASAVAAATLSTWQEVAARLAPVIGARGVDILQMKATRVVIDSLSGFELAVAPAFRDDFRESLFRMFAVLSNLGVTVLVTSELEDRYIDLSFSPYGAAFLTDAIIVQRYIEMESRLQRVMAVVKVRASVHCIEIRRYEDHPADGYRHRRSGARL